MCVRERERGGGGVNRGERGIGRERDKERSKGRERWGWTSHIYSREMKRSNEYIYLGRKERRSF